MSQSPGDDAAQESNDWIRARFELSEMIKRGRSFSGHEPNCAFLNLRNGRFGTVSAVSGFDYPDDARALALTDWDHDGDMDAWVSNRNAPRLRFFRNELDPTGHAWVALELSGDGVHANRDAIGARVEVETDLPNGPRLVRSLRAGSGFISQASKVLTIGLGGANQVKRITVRWPGGETQSWGPLTARQRYRLRQGDAEAVPLPERTDVRLRAREQPTPAPSRKARIPLITRLPMAPLPIQRWDGTADTLTPTPGRPVLVNLWASWCSPCLAELAELTRHAEEIRKAGIDVVALSVDGLGDQKSAADPAQLMRKMQFPFPTARATEKGVADLQRYHDNLVVMWRPLPVPSSFLIDASGHLSVIYQGTVRVEDLLRDAATPPTETLARQAWGALLPGSPLQSPFAEETARRAEMRTKYRMAVELQQNGNLATAEICLRELLALDPQCEPVHRRLVRVYMEQQAFTQAIEAANQVLAGAPQDSAMHQAVGLAQAGLGRPDRAIDHYKQVLNADPHDAETLSNLGTAWAMIGNLVEAEKAFRSAVREQPNFAPALVNLGRVLAATQRGEEAEKVLMEAVRLDPEHPEGFNNLGTIWAQRGDFRRAREFFGKALQVDPKNEEARRNLEAAQRQIDPGN